MNHILITPATCQRCKTDRAELNCPVCDQGLSICSVCGQGESELGPECPGERPKYIRTPDLAATDFAMEFIVYLRGRGFKLRAHEGKLMVSPKEAILPDDADTIRTNKAMILECLEWEQHDADSAEMDDAVAAIERRIGGVAK